MKYRILTTMILVGLICSCSSDMDTGGVSRLTSFPVISVNGASEILVALDGEYDDPGASAIAGDTPVDVLTSASGVYLGGDGVDTSVPDNYLVTYSAQNSDGFYGTALRSVWVANTGDLETSIEGLYLSSIQKAPDFEQSDNNLDLKYVLIWKTGDNTYEISHAIGGYYAIGSGFGPGYAARGAEITANDIPSNDFTISQAAFPIWGNPVDISEFTVDAPEKTITFTGTGNWGNSVFHVQLKQVQF